MLSQRARYALRSLVYLASLHGDRRASVAEVAETVQAPRKFLEAILLELKRHGLLESERGRFGGYALARAPAAISFADVIRALDGPLALAPCASKTAYRPCQTCPSVEACMVHPALAATRDAAAGVLEAWTLEKALAVGPTAGG